MPEPMHSTNGVTRPLLLAGMLLIVVLSSAYLVNPEFVNSTNNRTTDVLLSLGQKKPASGSVVIVDIDEKSLAQYGQWPWPRSRVAQLLSTISASGAASIGLDLILAEPDRTSPGNLQTDLDRGNGDRIDTSCIPNALPDHDQMLADTLVKGPYVLGYEFLFGNRSKSQRPCGLHPPGVVWINMSDAYRDRLLFFKAQGVVCNRRLFSDAVTRSGFLNATPDADGILRRVPMLIRFEDRLYPSLALATLMQYEMSSQLVILRREGSGSLEIMVGKRAFPVDTQGNLLVQFSRLADATVRVSAGDLLYGKTAPGKLLGKVVLIGSSAAGLDPVYQTSVSQVRSHVDIHAQLLEHLLTGQQVIRTGNFLWWEILVGLLLAACTGLGIARMGILPSAAVCATLLAGCWIGMWLLFRAFGYLFSPLLPSVMLVLNYVTLTLIKSWKIQFDALNVADHALIQLESSEKNLNSIIKAVPDVIFRLEAAGRITFISPAMAKYSASPEALLGQPVFPLIKREYRDAFVKLTDDVFKGVPGHLEFEAQGFKGGHVWLDTYVVPCRNDTGEIVSLLGVARDITDRKLVEQALAQKQLQLEELNRGLEQRIADTVLNLRDKDRILILQGRQAAMGEMIGNIAHQWRQPLNTLGLIVQELLMTYGRDEFNRESLELSVRKAMALIAHMSKTIEDFRNYFKPDKEKKLFNVNQSVTKTLSLFEPSFKSLSIDISVTAIDDADVYGYENEYSQVLLNILVNCRDAFESGAVEGERVITIVIFQENDRSVVTVADNAGGIPEDIVDKIFDPYFTTKGPDIGTGIGLYMAKTIIEKNMNGRLTVRNTAEGAEFRVEV